MDPADAYVKLYDQLKSEHADALDEWSLRDDVSQARDSVCAEVRATGTLDDRWLLRHAHDRCLLFGILRGLDLALLSANPETGAPDGSALDYLRARLELTGKLNDQAVGLLLPSRASDGRPGVDPDSIDDFLHFLRLSPEISADVQIHPVPALHDLPRTAKTSTSGVLEPKPPLTIAQLPLLAGPEDLRWNIVESDDRFYTVVPDATRIGPRLPAALRALDQSGASLAILPEGCLTDDLLPQWQELLKSTPRPKDGSLTWLLLGTGPVVSVGPKPQSNRLPNRAVLVHRNGWLAPLMTQDKLSGFCFTPDQQEIYRIDLGGVKRDEFISHNTTLTVLEGRAGRFAVQICEDFGRLRQQSRVVLTGATHIIVPVLAASMWDSGWQARAGQVMALDLGAKAAVSNGLAIERFYNETTPSPTLLTVVALPGRPDNYFTTEELVQAYSNMRAGEQSQTEDALTPRVAEW
ncbi:hypothetical protein [Amycolatopsis sp. NPDC059657]|uniref:hypothetical protein n=1 Tax=Amycolatopsis sp. NPDC059657 TaxID=3346899 RepID=UPI003672AA22